MASEYRIREARRTDLDALVTFTLQEALEAEGANPGIDQVTRGVRTGLEDPAAAVYWVAETADGRVVAATSVVTEWSNFYGGWYWWIQSLYIVPEHRGRGLADLLLDHVAAEAGAAGAADLRLQVHLSNERAIQAYRRCGFVPAPYAIMRRKPDAD